MTRITVALTLRQRAIILAILQSTERVTHERLACTSNLSIRVIRYNMGAVRAWFASHDVRLTSRSGYGIEIDASKRVRRQLLSALARAVDQDLALTGAQRRRAFLFELLCSDTPTSFQNLAVRAGSSRSTLIHDVGRMQEWLDRYRIHILRRPKRGISLEGQEHMRRFALLDVLREELGEEKWTGIAAGHAENLTQDKSLPGHIRHYLARLDLPFFGQMMIKIENNIGHRLTPNSHAGILVYVAIMALAVRQGKVSSGLSSDRVVQTQEYEVSKILLRDLARLLSIEIPRPEAARLAAFLLGSEWEMSNPPKGDEQASSEQPSPEALSSSQEIVSTCASQLHPLLQIDRELVSGLALHLERAMHRSRHGIPVENPLLGQVRARYAEIYRSAAYSVGKLEGQLGLQFSDDELGYITMYLAAGLERIGTNRRLARPVILATDGNRATVTLLKSRLGYEFSNLEIVGVSDPIGAAAAESPHAELVIALVPYQHPNLPTIRVGPFLTGEEVKGIRNWLASKEAEERRAALSQHAKLGIVELLEPSNIVFLSSSIDWRNAVPIAAQPLVDGGKIAPTYVQAMIQILEEFGPYMILAPGVILLHAKPSDGVNSLCFSLLVHRDGIDFGGTSGRVYAVFVLGAVDNQSHLTALFQLSDLIQKPGFVRKLRQATHAADALRAIWSYLTTTAPVSAPRSRALEGHP